MKKRWMKLLSLGLAAVVMGSLLAGCGDGTGKDADGKVKLKISFVKAGFGDEWLKATCDAYTKEHPNVTFELDGDADMTVKIGTRLEAGVDVPDIAMVLGTNWQQYAAKGYLADLTELYNSQMENGTLHDKIIKENQEVGKYAGKYYMVPWADVCNGFIYNEKLFRENGWKVPATVDEMFTLMDAMKAKGVTPFAFGGKVISYWDFPVLAWWAQYEGQEGMREFLKMESPEVYKQDGRLKALQIFEKIINDKTNYVEGAMGMDHTQSQMAFIQGKAAMIPMGAWFESEMRNSLPEEFQAKIMLAPAVTGAKMTNVSVCTSADMMFIPKKSKNVETAMDFLKFMCEDDMLKLFTKYTATPRPFNYDAADVDGLSEFGKSVISAWQSANKVYMYSDNPVYFMKYFYWPFAGAPYSRIQIGDETAQEAFDNDYNFAKDKWNETREELGLS